MELLLINHPLDCPVCDKGGECPLQNQAMSNGRGETRFEDVKRTFPKPINISSQVLLDRERCVLCARCTRFSAQVAGDPFIEMLERGALQQVGIYEGQPFESYFSGNTVQICPVGALTGAAYRFRSRPFDLVSSPGVCEHCASGCAIRTDHRRGKVLRRLAGDDPEVNEEWNCDKGRWAFQYATAQDRLTTPLVRDDDGALVPTSWPEALRHRRHAGWPRPRAPPACWSAAASTVEDAYAYAKFARVALGTNDVDFRARPHSAEEAAFLAAHVAGRGLGVTYADLEQAPSVLLVGLEPEEESPIVFLRLRKAVPQGPRGARGRAVRQPRPGEAVRDACSRRRPAPRPTVLDALRRATTGRRRGRACTAPARSCWSASGWPRSPARCPPSSGWPRPPAPGSPGCRAGPASAARSRPVRCPACCPAAVRSPTPRPGSTSPPPGASTRCPSSAGPRHRRHPRRGAHRRGPRAAGRRRRPARPARPGRGAGRDRRRAVRGQPRAARLRGDRARRRGAARSRRPSRRPAPSSTGRAATGRSPRCCAAPTSMPDVRVLHVLAEAMGVDLGLPDVAAARARARRARRSGTATAPRSRPSRRPSRRSPAAGEAVLATWSQLLDAGRLQDGEPFLAGTARPPSPGSRRRPPPSARRRRRRPRSPSPPTAARSRVPRARHRDARRRRLAADQRRRCRRSGSALAAGPGSVVRLTAGRPTSSREVRA